MSQLVQREQSPLNTPVPTEQIEVFEQYYGITIPQQFREFAQTVGLGRLGPGNGLHEVRLWLEAILEPTPNILQLDCHLDPNRGYDDYTDSEDPAQGSLTISSEGSYYTQLVVSGPNCGRLGRYEIESRAMAWIERAHPVQPATFFEWYEGWLDRSLGSVPTPNYGAGLIGSQEDLHRALADTTLTESTRIRAIYSLQAFPELHERTLCLVKSLETARLRAAAVPLLAKAVDGAAFLKAALDDDSAEVRLAALRAIQAKGDEAAQRAVGRLLSDPSDEVALNAIMLARDTPILSVEKLEELYAREVMRPHIVSAIAGFRDSRALNVLRAALLDSSADVRRVAAFSIGKMGHLDGLPIVQKALDTETEPSVRQALFAALKQLETAS